MDDLLSEFLTETAESLDVVDCELVKFEQDPNNAGILDNIFRLVHTIKGTCGFLGLPRLEALAHAGETLMGKFRDGVAVTPDAVTLILESLDRIKEILGELESSESEPAGTDEDLISRLDHMSAGGSDPAAQAPPAASEAAAPDAPEAVVETTPESDIDEPFNIVQRELKPGEVTLDDLERAFQDTPGPEDMMAPQAEPEAAALEPVQAAPEVVEPVAPVKAESAVEGAPAKDAEEKKDSAIKNQSIRVNVDTLESLMTTVSELVLTRNQLLEMVRRIQDSEFKVPLQRLSNVTAELQEGVMKTRMQPVGNAWQKLPRIVRDLAKDLDKKIDLEMTGAETELDRQVLELIKDPLTHMVRNSADHGLETPEERLAAGKSETGRVHLSAYHEGGHIIIEITDDGRGLDAERIKDKVMDNGLATQAELDKMTEAQIHKFIFKAGFSTAQVVTNVSGRGVGMDVVRTNIELIGGSVDVKSTQGKGSVFSIKIPLTLAIISALIVEASGHRFAVPQLAVVELVRAQADSDHRIEVINDTPVLRLRNKLLPLIHLGNLLDIEGLRPPESASDGDESSEDAEPAAAAVSSDEIGESSFIIVSQVGNQSFGIVVDGVFDTEEIVVKPMSTMLREISMFSGNTILGDGSVILIVDPNGIAQSIHAAVASDGEGDQVEEGAHVDSSERVISMLVFRAGSDEPKAVPLSLVTRLEEINVSEIERSNGRNVVQYRGKLMPLVYVDENAEQKDSGMQPILVFTDENHVMGLVVDEIIDIVEEQLNIEVGSDGAGIIGSAVVQGSATEVIDVGYYLPKAFDDWFRRKETGYGDVVQRVLLVDDSAFFRNMLSPVLSSGGFSVTAVESAHDALALCEQGQMFDVIVTDIEMPSMDGFALAEAISRNRRWASIPVLALSSHTSPTIIEKAREASFIDYVGKFDREGLMVSLKSAVEAVGEAA
jgi:two-component system chemotaxis sensor kinase CheA